LAGYLGLVPTERSAGGAVRRDSITKMGNARIRQLLVESAWTYRFPPRVGAKKQRKLDLVSSKICEIAWKAQSRLTARSRAFVAHGKKSTVARTAIARELTISHGGDTPLSSLAPRRGVGPRQGNSRQTLCGRFIRRPM
jgi:transposase